MKQFLSSHLADRTRVLLKGEEPGYIYASFVNVSATVMLDTDYSRVVYVVFYQVGLQAEEAIHHCSGSNGVHVQRLLEDGSRQEVWGHRHAVPASGK